MVVLLTPLKRIRKTILLILNTIILAVFVIFFKGNRSILILAHKSTIT